MSTKKYGKIRGGFSGPGARFGYSNFNKLSPSTREKVMKTAAKVVSRATKGKMSLKTITTLLGVSVPIAQQILAGVSTKRPFILPGTGTVTRRISSPPVRIMNKGTGTTKTNHTSGYPLSKHSWIEEGQRYIYNSTTAASSFTITSTPPRNGIDGLMQMPSSWLKSCRSLMFAGTGSITDPTQTSYLSERGTDFTGAMYLSNHRVRLDITSASNTNVRFRIYECVAKYDCALASLVTPDSAWKEGIDAAYGGNSNTSYLNPGIYPGHSEAFRASWEIDGVYDIELPAGASHIHTSTYNINTVLPNARYVPHTDGLILAGITRGIMVVVSPAVVHDSVNEDLVGYGATTIDIVMTRTSEYYGKPTTGTVINTDLSTDTITSARVMADSSEQDVAINN